MRLREPARMHEGEGKTKGSFPWIFLPCIEKNKIKSNLHDCVRAAFTWGGKKGRQNVVIYVT